MLDQETKRRIDNARDILVGKVPDPKSQVEQITIALIYKFMDDIDKSSEELGGEAQFFTDDFKQYAWSRLMDTKLSGQERLNLYTEGISKLGTHKSLPQLFRDIFKGAFLPYRDPNVLHIFLKEINGFTYDHSENLGNAFEYLLSIMGSQGDAGQFRTSRHIIDFIVDVVNPKKDETVLDPACGTAGFLISAYKHILQQHDGKDDPENKEKPLTPDEREKLMEHFVGYDISPDMVRLSLVNMYLHGFQGPKIFEYDTLGSEDHWDERYDVILANPPFMSPKGGVRPHRRFSIQANRTEVLFVDYITEHLTSEGRAGIIVPEGIIFQTGTAYKALRKMLIEEGGLYAVVSLPAGVFNPYSGVKTSILFLDKKLGKISKDILFVKIGNDGFDLGAQRKPLGHSGHLPAALEILQLQQKNTGETSKLILESDDKFAILASKEAIAADGEYSLSGDRFRVDTSIIQQKWPMVNLATVAEVIAGQSPEGIYYNSKGEGMPFYQGKTEFGAIYLGDPKTWTTRVTKEAEPGDILMSVRAPVGPVNIATQKICIGRGLAAIRAKNIEQAFLFYVLKQMQGQIKGNGGAVFDSINRSQIEMLSIPFPPIEIQKQIVQEIEIKQNAINSAEELIQSLERERRYFGRSIAKLENVEWVELDSICEINPKKSQTNALSSDTDVSFVPMADLAENRMYFKPQESKALSDVAGSYTYFAENDVLVAKVTPCFENGKAAIAAGLKNGIGFGSSEFIVLRASEKVLPEILYAFISSEEFRESGKRQMTGTGGLQRIPTDFVRGYKVPLPPMEVQEQVASEIRRLESAININAEIADWYQEKINDVIGNI